MSNNIKEEFKDFINTLSTEICKEVLLEDLKSINDSFNQTSNNYKALGTTYANNINSIKEELVQLQNTNLKLDEFVSSINNNNEKINTALDVIEGSHKEVINHIIEDNKSLFHQYNLKVHNFNIVERKQFISDLTSSVDIQSQRILAELKKVSNNRSEDILKETSSIANRLDYLELLITDIQAKLSTSELKVIEETKNKINTSRNQILERIDQYTFTTNSINQELNAKLQGFIEQINKNVNKKANFIIVLNLVIIAIFVVLMLS